MAPQISTSTPFCSRRVVLSMRGDGPIWIRRRATSRLPSTSTTTRVSAVSNTGEIRPSHAVIATCIVLIRSATQKKHAACQRVLEERTPTATRLDRRQSA
jgi:hypothetical protein